MVGRSFTYDESRGSREDGSLKDGDRMWVVTNICHQWEHEVTASVPFFEGLEGPFCCYELLPITLREYFPLIYQSNVVFPSCCLLFNPRSSSSSLIPQIWSGLVDDDEQNIFNDGRTERRGHKGEGEGSSSPSIYLSNRSHRALSW